MRVGSLFSGIGGLDLGLERAGMRVSWQVEIDHWCRRVLAKHWPNVTRHEDVRNVGADNLSAVDLVCGGFPCQDLSIAGRRKGLAGERSGLWFEFHRVLAETRPQWVVIENVPGLLSSHGGRDFAVLLRGLVELGYGACWRILDAQYFGVAQRRRRVFIVASLGDGRAAQVLFESDSLSGNPPESREEGQSITGALTGSAHSSSAGNPDDNRAQAGFLVTATETGVPDPAYAVSGAGTRFGSGRHNQDTFVVAHALTERHDSSEDGTGRGTPLVSAVYPQLTSGVRRLTPVECERLQGFPDGWTEGESDSARYRMLGNAVCVPVAEHIGRLIMAVEGQA